MERGQVRQRNKGKGHVSEGLNSVERQFTGGVINYGYVVSEGLNSVESEAAGGFSTQRVQVSEGLNSVESSAQDARQRWAPMFQKD